MNMNNGDTKKDEKAIIKYCPECQKEVELIVDPIPVMETHDIDGDYDVATCEYEVIYGFCPFCKNSIKISSRYVRDVNVRAR